MEAWRLGICLVQPIDVERAVARRFGLTCAPTLLSHCDAGMPLAFTRLKSEAGQFKRSTAAPPESAFILHIALGPVTGEIWADGRQYDVDISPGGTFIFHLASNPMVRFARPFDLLQFYLPTVTLDRLGKVRKLPVVEGLRTVPEGVQDSVMLALAMSLLPALESPETASPLFIESVALAFHAHVVQAYGKTPVGGRYAVSRLAPWQLRRALTFADTHFNGAPSTADLAAECRLSMSHFAKAFRETVGMPPHRWILTRRIERVKELILTDNSGLGQIALSCGFSDQSHMTRVFKRFAGYTPAEWRKLHR